MKPQMIRILMPDEMGRPRMVNMEAAPTPTPGLVVNKAPVGDDQWNVTHLASGCTVAVAGDPELALHLAIRLGPVCDWTQGGATLRTPGNEKRAKRVLREAGAVTRTGAMGVTDRYLAEMEPLT